MGNFISILTSLTGGGAKSLDSIDGNALSAGDIAKVVTADYVREYYLNATSGASESVPNVIAPDSNAGTKRWELIENAVPYDIGGTWNGVTTNGLVLIRVPVARAITFPSGMTGSNLIAETAATAQTVFSLKKNGVEFGTATFAASGTSATFAAASETSFAAGDILTVVAPATADATLADLGWAIVGSR